MSEEKNNHRLSENNIIEGVIITFCLLALSILYSYISDINKYAIEEVINLNVFIGVSLLGILISLFLVKRKNIKITLNFICLLLLVLLTIKYNFWYVLIFTVTLIWMVAFAIIKNCKKIKWSDKKSCGISLMIAITYGFSYCVFGIGEIKLEYVTINDINSMVNLKKGNFKNVVWNINKIDCVNFNDAKIQNCDFRNCKELTNCNFKGTEIYNTKFSGLTQNSSKEGLNGIHFEKASFYNEEDSLFKISLIDTVTFYGCFFQETNFSYVNATKTIFSHCTFDSSTCFQNTNLENARFINPKGLDTTKLKNKIYDETTLTNGLEFRAW